MNKNQLKYYLVTRLADVENLLDPPLAKNYKKHNMRPPPRGRKPKTGLQTSSGDESVQTHSSDLSDEDLEAILGLSKQNKKLHGNLNNPDKGNTYCNPNQFPSLHATKGDAPNINIPSQVNGTQKSNDNNFVPPVNDKNKDLRFILAGHANLHKAANNAAQMSMHIHQQFKNFKLNDNGQVVKSSKVGKGTKRKGKPATVEEWNDHRKFGPPSTPVDNNRSHTGRGQFYLRDEFCKDSDFNNASSEMDTISSEDDISTDSEELDQYEKNLQNLLTTVRAATGGGRRGALVLMKFLILLLKQPKG